MGRRLGGSARLLVLVCCGLVLAAAAWLLGRPSVSVSAGEAAGKPLPPVQEPGPADDLLNTMRLLERDAVALGRLDPSNRDALDRAGQQYSEHLGQARTAWAAAAGADQESVVPPLGARLTKDGLVLKRQLGADSPPALQAAQARFAELLAAAKADDVDRANQALAGFTEHTSAVAPLLGELYNSTEVSTLATAAVVDKLFSQARAQALMLAAAANEVSDAMRPIIQSAQQVCAAC